jgi:hypothetical protein
LPDTAVGDSSFTVGGTVSGLSGTGLVVQDNGGDDLAISANGDFSFPTPLAANASYLVVVKTQPSNPSQTCMVASASGTMGSANVTDVTISCTTNTYTVGGSVIGLAGGSLVLKNSGTDNLTISANGSFSFATAVPSGAAYVATVELQPSNPPQICRIANGSGIIVDANVMAITVNCMARGTITQQQRHAILTDVENQWTQVVQQGANFSSAMAQYLASRSELTDVTVEPDGSVSAQFSDGRLLVVAHNQTVVQDTFSVIRATDAQNLPPGVNAPTVADTASKKKAIISQGFGPVYKSMASLTADLTSWLNAENYNAIAFQSVTPADLRTAVKQVDVFVHTGHAWLLDAPDGKEYAVATAVLDSAPEDGADFDDFANDRLVYFVADVDDMGHVGTYWAITGKFVTWYMSFNKGSLVIINACNSATPFWKVSAEANAEQSFAAAFWRAGADAYLGWQGATGQDLNDRIRYVIDRLLGELPGGGGRQDTVPQESPPQRAFNLQEVLADMTAQGMIPVGPNQVTLLSLGPNDAILAPSIAYVGTDEVNGLLWIFGIFDPNQKANADVTVDGQECSINDWGPTSLTCALPQAGLGTEGDVVVTVNGIRSNVVRLTAWRGAFTYQIAGGGSLQLTAHYNLHWRSDIHKWRTAPHVTPQHYLFWTTVAADSTATWSASGTQTVTDQLGNPSTVTIGGSGSLSLPGLASTVFGGSFAIDPDAQMQWTNLEGEAINQVSVSGDACPNPESFLLFIIDQLQQQVSTYQSPPPIGTQQSTLPAMPLAIDANYSLIANAKNGSYFTGCPWSLSGTPAWQLSWPQIAATHPPDPTAAQ